MGKEGERVKDKMKTGAQARCGARVYFAVGMALISLIPLLSLIYLRVSDTGLAGFTVREWCILFFGVGLSVIIGYVVQSRYPRTIMKLRVYLEQMVQGELPDKIDLIRGEDDISAIENCLNLVLTQLRKELKTMEVQKTRLEDELFQARKLEAIGTLASGISHEISTPLQFISNNVQFLDKACRETFAMMETDRKKADDEARLGFLREETAKAARQCQEGVERVAKILKAMRDFAQGQENSERASVEINEVIESAIALSRNEWKYASELETRLDPDLPAVSCYPSEIKQVVINLIVNAAQATETLRGTQREGIGKITVTTRREDEAVVILVTDTGAGIPEHLHEKIFDPFFSTKELPSGMGQGLSFAHSSVVTRHGGRLTFRTAQGKGTTFTVRLPLKRGGLRSEGRSHEEYSVCG